ncbi:hypothetical protein PFISCL1PPCAC_3674, partial [Pristionchus fissidentatus]
EAVGGSPGAKSSGAAANLHITYRLHFGDYQLPLLHLRLWHQYEGGHACLLFLLQRSQRYLLGRSTISPHCILHASAGTSAHPSPSEQRPAQDRAAIHLQRRHFAQQNSRANIKKFLPM